MQLQFLNKDFISSAIKEIGSDIIGQKIMEKKSQIIAFKVTDLTLPATLILKQTAISVGGDFATPKECILAKEEAYDGILFVTFSQLNYLIQKIQNQPFGLKKLGEKLKSYLKNQNFKKMIMAIINLTPDSFFVDSRYTTKLAIQEIDKIIQTEVEIIDIGGASSRPGSELIDPEIELERLRKVFDFINRNALYQYKKFSIDTYNVEVAKVALDSGFTIINDVSGFKEKAMQELAGKYGATTILMHTKGTPKEMQNYTEYTHLFTQIEDFFIDKITKLKEHGVKNIILDVGFGFAKNLEQNLELIRHIGHFKKFDLPLLLGASRKSTIQKILNKDAEGCLSGTLALHLLALQNGVNILRVHDVQMHLDLLKMYEAYYA